MAGFAGSQRGDRRRRRLAAETDERGDDRAGAARCADFAPGERLDGAHCDTPASVELLSLPLADIVPLAWWKYSIAALICLALAVGIAAAGQRATEWSLSAAEIARLFALPEAPVARWYSSLLLTLSGQLACLIWWARSKSLKDFNGRYWLWLRIAFLWFTMGGCLATGAHAALPATLRGMWHSAPSWLVKSLPAVLLLIWTTRALLREMGGCRYSRGVLLAAASAYLTAGALQLERDRFISAAIRPALLQASLLLGHVGVFLSMWLHARHVVHCTPDPASIPGRRWKLPRPHLRFARWPLPRLGRRRSEVAAPLERQSQADEPEQPVKKSTAESHTPAPAASPTPKAAAAAKPRLRLDLRHEEFLGGSPSSKPDVSDRPNADDSSTTSTEEPVAPGPLSSPGPSARSEDLTRDSDDGADSEEEGRSESGMLSKPDLRGLSKKQRRRLIQEHRQRERDLER